MDRQRCLPALDVLALALVVPLALRVEKFPALRLGSASPLLLRARLLLRQGKRLDVVKHQVRRWRQARRHAARERTVLYGRSAPLTISPVQPLLAGPQQLLSLCTSDKAFRRELRGRNGGMPASRLWKLARQNWQKSKPALCVAWFGSPCRSLEFHQLQHCATCFAHFLSLVLFMSSIAKLRELVQKRVKAGSFAYVADHHVQ